MPPGITAEAQQFLAQVLAAHQAHPDALRGKSAAARCQWLLDAGYIEKMPSLEVAREAKLIFRRMREKQN